LLSRILPATAALLAWGALVAYAGALLLLGGRGSAGPPAQLARAFGIGAFVYAALWSGLTLAVLRFSIPDRLTGWRVPLSVILMGTVLAFGGVLGLRVLRRYLYELAQRRERGAQSVGQRVPTLLIGAGQGVLAVRESPPAIEPRRQGSSTTITKQGAVIHGIRILGTTEELLRPSDHIQRSSSIAQIRGGDPPPHRAVPEIQVDVRIIPGSTRCSMQVHWPASGRAIEDRGREPSTSTRPSPAVLASRVIPGPGSITGLAPDRALAVKIRS
jgi:hypothetical protein